MLANAPFRKLWTAMSVCSLGDWLNLIALTALASHFTRDSGFQVQSLAIGGVFLAKMLPAVLLGPIAGAVADRFDRRLTMVVADVARFAVVLSIPLVGSYRWMLVATVLLECVNLFWVPAKDATVPNLVPKDQLEEANRFNLLVTYGTAPLAAALFSVLSLVAEMLGGAVPSFAAEPASLALYVNALAYWVSAILIFTLKDIPRRAISAPSVLRQIADGWRYVGRTPLVRGLVIGMAGAFAAGGAVIGVARLYVAALGGGDPAYGAVFAAVFAGMALGMFFGLRLLRELSRRRLFGLAIVAAGLVLTAIALITNMVVVTVLTVALGACAGIAWIIGYTLIGLEVEDGLRGRTFAFLQSLARVVLLVVVAVAPALAALFGQHTYRLAPTVSYTFGGPNLVLVIGALLAITVGVVALRHMDDRRNVPLLADLAAALRGARYVPDEPGPERRRGVFIAFEGGEGSGKTTQARMLAIWLRDQGYDVEQTREPGATKVGMRLRAILLDAAHQGLSARAETMLYAADRAEHVEKVIRPALERGAIVVSDRYVDSSLAYQGAGRALDQQDVARINEWATGGLVPDLTIVVDVPPEVGLARFASPADRIEAEPLEFHERVRREFRALAAADPDRYLVVDGTQTPEEIAAIVQDRVREILPDPVPGDAEAATGTMPAIRDRR
ncbi:hypothetical protein GCM10010106_18450 [Thermopolyspora flexuosa]|uniref:Thymidylate kinase n=1 Tax=Thermopolyspora flexuosa TaxID=103836 RepID=A0A543J465_9ACTN|nr:thymidylate kinase [Thermopolyspora flexuosa]GGM72394.1 hypothetical protein GCM10010106_18450 [Thermopolyspora flexuosa]